MCYVDIQETFGEGEGVGNEKERFIRNNCESGDELLSQDKAKVQVGSELSEDFLIQVGAHQGFVLLPLPFAIAVDVISENTREECMNEILYADDLVLVKV